MTELERMGEKARAAARVLAGAGAKKQQALLHAADCLSARAEEVLKANTEDLEAAQAQGMRPALQDRLRLTTARIEDMCRGLRETAAYLTRFAKTRGVARARFGRYRAPERTLY